MTHTNIIKSELIKILDESLFSMCVKLEQDGIRDRLIMFSYNEMKLHINIDINDKLYDYKIRGFNIQVSLKEIQSIHKCHSYNINGIYFYLRSMEVNSDFSIYKLYDSELLFSIILVELNDNKILDLLPFNCEDLIDNKLVLKDYYDCIICNSWQVDILNTLLDLHFNDLIVYCDSSIRCNYVITYLRSFLMKAKNVCFYIKDSYYYCYNSSLYLKHKLDVKSKLKMDKNNNNYHLLSFTNKGRG